LRLSVDKIFHTDFVDYPTVILNKLGKDPQCLIPHVFGAIIFLISRVRHDT
jgi:hypothetical protein